MRGQSEWQVAGRWQSVPVAVDGAVSPVGAGAGAVLGQGCFGTVSSMTYNGAPVAVKELSATTLDAASLGESR